MITPAIWILTVLFVIVSFRKDRRRTVVLLQKSVRSWIRLSSNLLGMIAFVGLTLAAFTENQLASFFMGHDTRSFLLAPLIGALVTMPGPLAFPLAGSLIGQGANPSLVASFLTTMTMVGVASAPVEIAHFGRKFTLLRQTLSFIAAVVISSMMGAFL